MTNLHILLDPSGAHLCLENSLVCSHLESLLTKIRVVARRGDKTIPARADQWEAFEQGAPVQTSIAGVEVRETKREVIVGSR